MNDCTSCGPYVAPKWWQKSKAARKIWWWFHLHDYGHFANEIHQRADR